MPRVSSRNIPVYFKPPQVSVSEVDKIILYYNNGIPLADIVRRVQFAKSEREGKCLSYPDIYTILFHAKKDGRITQRQAPLGELPISDFPLYFQAFRDGKTFQECLDAITEAGRKATTVVFHTKLFRAMGDRHRDHSRKFTDALDKASAEERGRRFLLDLVKYFKRTLVGPANNRRPAVIIYTDDLPRDFVVNLHSLNTDLSRELLLILAPGILSDLEQEQVKIKTQEPKVLSNKTRQQLADEAVAMLGLAVENDPSLTAGQKPKPVPVKTAEEVEDDQELAVLTPEQLEAEEAELPGNIPLPSAHNADSQGPTNLYSLENLADDDELEPLDESPNVAE